MILKLEKHFLKIFIDMEFQVFGSVYMKCFDLALDASMKLIINNY